MSGSEAPGSKGSILVIDPEKDHVELVRDTLEAAGFDVIACPRGDSGLEIAIRHKPDLVLLEVKVLGLSGLDVCRRLREDERTRSIPVIILSALSSELDRVVGLELGADDYVSKPFSTRELLARIRAVLRRVSGVLEPCTVRHCGDLSLDLGRREVRYGDRLIPLTALQFRVLECLLRHPGRALSRAEILQNVHEDAVAVEERTIDVHVAGMRRKLGKGGFLIETLRGFGYRLRDQAAAGPVPAGLRERNAGMRNKRAPGNAFRTRRLLECP